MKINISGHHLNVKDSVKSHVEEKLAKIAEHFPELITADVTLTIDNKKMAIAEIDTLYHGHKINVKDSQENVTKAISAAVKKLDRVLNDKKGIEKAARKDTVAEVIPDYTHEHLQSMALN